MIPSSKNNIPFSSEHLKFPLVWNGRLLTYAETPDVEENVKRIYAGLGLTDGTIINGNVSSRGRYVTWQLKCTAPSLEVLRALFSGLETLPGVRMLI